MLCFSCSEKNRSIQTNELIGVWSGLLFQTESKYDSIVVAPANNPTEATLYKNGKKTSYPIILNQGALSFKGASGLRFDGTIVNDQALAGILTNDLWAKSLPFEKVQNQWIAKIQKAEIIDTDYIVYLEFYQDAEGSIQANIQSNKENRKLHFTIEKVLIDGYDIDFNTTNDRFGISAKYNGTEKNITLNYGNRGGKRTIVLTKLPANTYEGYTPRSSNKKYEYKIPKLQHEQMQTAALEDVGIKRSLLDFMDEMHSGKYEHIHSIIITKDKKLVFEEYFHGYSRESLHDIRSAFKSLATLIMGKAMMLNSDLEVNNILADYYPEYEISDPEKKKITIHHALTMTTGIELENEDEMQWDHSDWVGYKLNLPMKYKPGEKFEYSSGGMNLLTGVIEQSTKKYLPLFFYEEVLLPMGIQKFQMRTSPVGRAYLPGDFYLRPIDFTKFGLLVLNYGVWNNQQIIASDWIDISTQPYEKGSWPKDSEYGYLWRLLKRKVGNKQINTIEAWGNGGQFLIIIPELDMTITFTGGNYNLFPEMEETPFKILNKYILPAVILENK